MVTKKEELLTSSGNPLFQQVPCLLKPNIMKKIFLTLLAAAMYCALPGQTYDLQWQLSAGSTLDDEARDVALDASGNSFVTGYFQGTVDFNPGAGVANLTAFGGKDIFIAKYDVNGVFQWVKQIGGTSDEEARAIQINASGTIYITGYFRGTCDFNPDAIVNNLTSGGGEDPFVARYTSSGSLLSYWGITGGVDATGDDITTDNSGNVYITGDLSGTHDFNPGAGTAYLTPVGSIDLYFAKYSSTGTYIWAKRIGDSGLDYGEGIAVDASGYVYLTGSFDATPDFDPGTGTYWLSSNGGHDAFIACYNSSGTFQWANSAGGVSNEYAFEVVFDGAGNVYSTGRFNNTVDFNSGSGTYNLSGSTVGDIFLWKNTTAGVFVWAGAISGTGSKWGEGLAIDVVNNFIALAGRFTGTADFDPGTGTANLTSSGPGENGYIVRYSLTGSYIEAKRIGGDVRGWSVAANSIDQRLVIAGGFSDYITFFDDFPITTVTLYSAGLFDIHAANYYWGSHEKRITAWTNETGINDVSVYPNPSNGSFSVAGLHENDVVEILDTKGTKVYARKISEEDYLTVDDERFENGIYFLSVLFPDGTKITKKVAINR